MRVKDRVDPAALAGFLAQLGIGAASAEPSELTGGAAMFSREPYPGLRSFRKDESDIFFGRDDHVAGMIEKLAATHFLCVTGSSGCGKSSLARTGLQNALEAGFLKGEGSDWVFCDFHPGNRPLDDLLETLAGADRRPRRDRRRGARWPRARPASAGSSSTISSSTRHGLTEVAVHDQRYGQPAGAAARRPVRGALPLRPRRARRGGHLRRRAARRLRPRRKKVYVAITIRTDELDKCSRYPGLTDAVNAGQFLTPALDRFQIKEAIEGPVMLFGGTVEPTLSTWLLNSLEREEDKLPLMQHALKFLYAQAAAETPEGERITLTLAGMHALFGGQPKRPIRQPRRASPVPLGPHGPLL